MVVPVAATLCLYLLYGDPVGGGAVLDLVLAAGAVVAGRRPAVGGVIAGAALSILAFTHAGEPRFTVVLGLLPLYWAAARGRLGLFATLSVWFVAAGTVFEVGWAASPTWAMSAASGWIYLVLAAMALGLGVHALRRRQLRRLDGIERVARQRRRYLARELHDTVARDLTRIVLQTEGALSRGGPRDERDQVVVSVLVQARQALDDLRTLMIVMHDDLPPAPEHMPRSASVAEVLERQAQELRQAGFEPICQVDTDLTDVSGSLEDVVSRLLIEATANIVRHGESGTSCSIMIEHTSSHLEIAVINEVGRISFAHGTGLGLLNISEAVRSAGGEFSAEKSGSHWLVQAEFPVDDRPTDRKFEEA